MKLNQPDGATPIREDDLHDLIPALTIQDELNEFEQKNIESAAQWATRSRKIKSAFPDLETIKLLHEKMFDETWKWAGEFRKVELSIGIEWSHIASEIKKLADDVSYWLKHSTYLPDEIAYRFHHRLVFIHPFKNGNGRHARLATDLLMAGMGIEPFTWGAQQLKKKGAPRATYIAALKAADSGDFSLLAKFVRT